MIRFSCSWSHLGSRWMSSWGTVTVGAWRAENIYLNTCWIWGKFSINRRSLSTLFHYHRCLSRQKAHMALKLLFINSFCACVPKSPFLDDKNQNILSGKSEYVREKMNHSDLRVTSSNRRQWRENAPDHVLCVCLFLFTFTRRWNAGTTIEMKWNEMQGTSIDCRLCFP